MITPERKIPWGERGLARYALIFYDIIRHKPKKRRFQEK
jgi:hypothetical protein